MEWYKNEVKSVKHTGTLVEFLDTTNEIRYLFTKSAEDPIYDIFSRDGALARNQYETSIQVPKYLFDPMETQDHRKMVKIFKDLARNGLITEDMCGNSLLYKN